MLSELGSCGQCEREGGVFVTHSGNVEPHSTLNVTIQVFLLSISLPGRLVPCSWRGGSMTAIVQSFKRNFYHYRACIPLTR